MTLTDILTYYDDERNKEFFYEDYDYDDLYEYIRDFIDDYPQYEEMDLDKVAEDMANDEMDIPDGIGNRLHNRYYQEAIEWNRDPKFDEFDALGL
jgi:hypothetical protein